MSKKKSVVITGGAGFLGSHLCDRFIQDGLKVFCIDNLITGSLKNIKQLSKNKNFDMIIPSKAVHELLKIWSKALEAIDMRDWDRAETLFRTTLKLERQYAGRPTNPSEVYLKTRIPFWREEQTGDDWEAVWAFDSK